MTLNDKCRINKKIKLAETRFYNKAKSYYLVISVNA